MPATTAAIPAQAPGPLEAVPAKPEQSPVAGHQGRTAVMRMCECGLATDDLGLLEDHLRQHGHRERVPCWDKYTQVILASW